MNVLRRAMLLTVAVTWGATPAMSQTPDVAQLAWLSGCWEARAANRVTEEQWMAPRGGSLVGMARTVRGERLGGYELVVIREADTTLHYVAHPSGQPTAVFPLRDAAATSVTFENPDHDFPQRIGYALQGADSLLAWIEGTDNGELRRVEFRYRRAACPR